MSLQHISTAVDHEKPMKGDVIIAKRTIFDPKAKGHRLLTVCTKCGVLFPAEFRRMGKLGTARGCEVRSISQCSECRSRYHGKAKARQPELPGITQARKPGEFRVGDLVRTRPGEYVGGATSGPVRLTYVGPGRLMPGAMFVGFDAIQSDGKSISLWNPERFELVGEA